MTYLRRQVVKGKHGVFEHYQILEGYWHKGKAKYRVICNLGKHHTLEDALVDARKRGFPMSRRIKMRPRKWPFLYDLI